MAGHINIRQWVLYSFFLCAAIMHLGCAAQKAAERKDVEMVPRPAWTIAGAHPDFPSPRYIQGVGLAKEDKNPAADRQSADQNAFSEIIRQISADVSSEISVEKIGILGDKGETVLEKTISGTKIRANLTVGGLVIAERFYSPYEKLYYSLGVLDRISASEPYRLELLQYKENYQKYLQSALQYRKSGKVSLALLSLKDAYNSAVKFHEVFASYQIVAGKAGLGDSEFDDPPSPSVVLNKLSEIVSHLQMEILEGNRQKFLIGKPLSKPLSVRLMLNDEQPIPAEGLSIQYHFKVGNGELTSSFTQTDNEGRASASITRIEPSEDKELIVSASLNLHEFLDYSRYGEEWNKRIPASQNEILFNLGRRRAPESTRVLVLIQDTDASGELPLVIRDLLFQHLTASGFIPVGESEIGGIDSGLIRKIPQNIGSSNLRKQLPRIALIVLVEANLSSCSYSQGMKVCGVTGAVRAVTVDKGNAIATKSFQNIRGFGITGSQAAENAFKNAGEKVAEPLIIDILEKYVSSKNE